MSQTAEEIFKIACAHIDSMTDAGEIDSNTTADYRGRALSLINVAQKELIRVSDNYTIYEIARSKTRNMLGDGNHFGIYEYEANEDKTFEVENDTYGSVKAYHFESDATSGTVYIEDYNGSWNTLATVSLSNTGIGFKTYSGTVTPTSGATKSRIRFSGTYYYRYTNVALFNYNYATAPIYRAWIPVQLPVDCIMISKVTRENETRVYTNDSVYKIERTGSRQTLFINYNYEGTLKVHYRPIPTDVTAFTDTLSVDDLTSQAISYYLAMSFVATEQNTDLRNQFMSQYENLKAELRYKQPESEIDIVDFYGGV